MSERVCGKECKRGGAVGRGGEWQLHSIWTQAGYTSIRAQVAMLCIQ